MRLSNHTGFSLIELMAVLAIIGIMSAIAIPSYQDYTRKARRTEAKGALMDLANRMEKYYLDNNTYVGATVVGVGATTTTTPNGYYTVAITAQDGTSYTLTATPVRTDAKCTTFRLNSAGNRAYTGTGSTSDCW